MDAPSASRMIEVTPVPGSDSGTRNRNQLLPVSGQIN